MKKILQTLLIIISFLFVSGVNAKTTYNNTPDFSNDYIKHYKDYTRYLVTTDSPYGYDSGIVAYDDDYKTGGLLNEYEFNMSKDTTGNTYLFNGLEYWTMTKSGSGMRFIDPSVASYLNTKSKNLLSGIRVTNYVQNGVYLRGSGTINDPWTFIEKYYVRFVYDDTKVTITPQVIMVPNEGTAIVTVTNSTNYEYAGNDCNGTYNSSTEKLTISNIKKDTTCNITTALKEHTITYTPSGLCTPTTKKVKHTRAMGTLCSPTKTGYTFKGWYEGGVQVNENTEVLSDMTIEAKFEANKYTLTYDNNNGTGCTSKEGTYDQTWGSLCTPTRTGYTFKGWYTSLSGGTKFEATEKVAGNKTVYARWEGNKFTVEYNGNGNTSGSVDSHECTYDGTCTLKANGFAKTGYTFVGWKKANTGDTIAAGGSIKNAATSGTVTYYAQWTANKFTVAYNGNGSTSGSVDSHECTYDGTCTLKANGFTKTGYTFAGWKKANSGNNIAAGTSIKNAATSGTVTYYAQWTANALTFTGNSVTKTFSTSAQTQANYVNAASNGTGTYTYAIIAGNGNSYFSLNGRTLNIKASTPASSYTLTIRATDSNSNVTKDATYTVNIDNANPTCPTVTAYSGNYDGSSHTVTVSGGSNGTIQYRTATSGDGSTWTTTKPTRTDAGTTTVYVRIVGNTNYNTNGCGSKTIVISTVDAVCPTVTAYSGDYNGNSHSVTVSGGSGGTIQYRTSTSGDGSTWTTTQPSRTSAGTTTVYVRVSGDSNHNTVTCGNKNIVINKVTPTITLSATSGSVNKGSTVTFNEKASVKGKFTVSSSDTGKATVTQASANEIAANTNNTVTVKGVAKGSATITVNFTPTDTTNYNSAAAKTYAITVNDSSCNCDTKYRWSFSSAVNCKNGVYSTSTYTACVDVGSCASAASTACQNRGGNSNSPGCTRQISYNCGNWQNR